MVRGKVWISLIPEGNKVTAGASPKATSKTKEEPESTQKEMAVSDE